jgi:archaellum biogenesis ATPase FlaH
MFDSVRGLGDDIYTEDIENVNNNNNVPVQLNEYDEQTDIITNNLETAQKVPLKPLIVIGKTQKLLRRLNTPFTMLIWGEQGSGKSSLLLSILDDLSVNGKVLLVVTEEKVSHGRIGERARLMSVRNLNKIDILETNKLSDLTNALENKDYKFVAIDSKDVFVDEKYLLPFFEKYNKSGVNFITVSHSTKDGATYTGDRQYAYLCNTEIKVDKNNVATVLKHRDATKGEMIAIFSRVPHRNKGIF